MVYYIKQDSTTGVEGGLSYFEDTNEFFFDMPFGIEVTKESLQEAIGGKEILSFREATHLEYLAWYIAYDVGYSDGIDRGWNDRLDFAEKTWPLIDK